MICRLCLTETEFCISLKNAKTQEEDEEFEDRAGIIGKHFDLSLDVNSDLVCTVCWQQVKDFHLFYLFIEEKQKEISQQSRLLALTSTKIEPKLTEYEHELFTKDATADEMHLRNESIIDTKNTPMVPENTFRQWNKVGNPQEWNENLEFVKNDELIEEVDLTNAMSPRTIYEQDAEMRDEDEDDDRVDIKDESTIDISSPMITENNLSQWDKVANLHEETENRPTAQNDDLIDTVNVEQSSNSTNANGNSNDVSVTTGVLGTETHRKKASNENIQQILDHRNQRKNFILKCDLCAQNLENFDKLKQHFKDQHNCEGYVRCCNKQYYCSQYYTDHLEWHLNPNLWKCGTCDRVYDCRVSYEFHLSTTHEVAENFKFRCTICPAKFTQEYLLHHHEKDYHSDHELKCDKCKKGFQNLESLKGHQQLKHQKLKCDECNKEFKSVGTLTFHKRKIHLGIYRTSCDICGKIFETSYKCKLHKAATHLKAAALKYKCPHCPKKFGYMSLLNNHKKKVHCKQKFKCDECNKEFKSVDSLTFHKRKVHLGTYRTACDICGKIFPTPYNIKLHKASAHPEEATLKFQCPHCPQKFVMMALLNVHKKSVHCKQKLKCDQCNKEFKSVGTLTIHKRRNHLGAERTACDICGKIFVTATKCKVHKGGAHPEAVTLNFQCPHCPKKFVFMSLLNTHKKRVHCQQKLKCDECNKEFQSVENLAMHKRRIHLGIYRTSCDICGKIVQTPAECKIHKARAHPEAVTLSFQCSHCPKKFAMRALLNLHEKNDYCKQKLKSKSNPPLRAQNGRNLRTHKIVCYICCETFSSKSNYELHKEAVHKDTEDTDIGK